MRKTKISFSATDTMSLDIEIENDEFENEQKIKKNTNKKKLNKFYVLCFIFRPKCTLCSFDFSALK